MLLGAWWGAWLLLLVRGGDRGWWLLSLTPSELDRALGLEKMFMPILAAKSGIALFGSLDFLVVLLCLAATLLGLLLVSAGYALHVDRERVSRRALLDILRHRRFVAVSLVPVALFLVSSWLFGNDWIWLAMLPWVLIAPFLVWSRSWLSPPGSGGVFTWAWPGWRPLGVALAISIAATLVDHALDEGALLAGRAIWFAAQSLAWPIGCLTSLLVCATWIDRFDFAALSTRLAHFLRWRPVGAFLALEVRLGVITLWFLAPLLACTVASIWLLPQVEELLRQSGRSLPVALRWMRTGLDGWLIVVLLCLPLLLAISGRLYVLLFPVVPEPVARSPRNAPKAIASGVFLAGNED